MPRSDLARAGIMLVFGAVFAGLGCWVVSLALGMVGTFGESMGVDPESRQIFARIHIAVHLVGTASASVIGLFLMRKRHVLARLAVLAIICFGGYGIFNMIGFTTTNRLAVSEAKTAANA